MKLARFVRGATLANAVFYAVLIGFAYPAYRAMDAPLLAATVVLAIGNGLLAMLRDDASHALKEGEDRRSEIILSLLVLAGVIVGAVDLGRLPDTPAPPTALRWAGVAAMALGYALRAYAFSVNTFFAGVIALQRDRGHHVVDHGPYAWVRHPGYAALVPLLLGIALALASYLALIPMGAALAVMVMRTVREDRYLLAELDGYSSYAERVRYRLAPGLW